MNLTLLYPFTTPAGVHIKEITTRRLKVKDLKSIGQQAGTDEVLIEMLGVARMCNLVVEDLEEMDAVDYQKVKERFLEYVGVTKATAQGNGATSEMVPIPTE